MQFLRLFAFPSLHCLFFSNRHYQLDGFRPQCMTEEHDDRQCGNPPIIPSTQVLDRFGPGPILFRSPTRVHLMIATPCFEDQPFPSPYLMHKTASRHSVSANNNIR